MISTILHGHVSLFTVLDPSPRHRPTSQRGTASYRLPLAVVHAPTGVRVETASDDETFRKISVWSIAMHPRRSPQTATRSLEKD